MKKQITRLIPGTVMFLPNSQEHEWLCDQEKLEYSGYLLYVCVTPARYWDAEFITEKCLMRAQRV